MPTEPRSENCTWLSLSPESVLPLCPCAVRGPAHSPAGPVPPLCLLYPHQVSCCHCPGSHDTLARVFPGQRGLRLPRLSAGQGVCTCVCVCIRVRVSDTDVGTRRWDVHRALIRGAEGQVGRKTSLRGPSSAQVCRAAGSGPGRHRRGIRGEELLLTVHMFLGPADVLRLSLDSFPSGHRKVNPIFKT